MGFVHADDAAQEIRDAAQIDVKVAQSVADAINKRIFAPIRTDIDKAYQPPPGGSVTAGPKIIQDIGTPPVAPASINVEPPAPPKPSDAGWSRTPPGGPTVQFKASQIAPPPAPPKAVATPPPSAAPKPVSAVGVVSEFDRLGLAKQASIPTPPIPTPASTSSSAPKPSAEPAPIMLHEDTSFKATAKETDFRLSRPDEGAEMKMDASKISSMPVRPAVIEVAGPSGQSAPPAGAVRMVHYTELQTASMNAPAPSGERKLTEITSGPPMPPPPPAQTPPPIPKPPTPPPPPSPDQKNPAPIVKNYP